VSYTIIATCPTCGEQEVFGAYPECPACAVTCLCGAPCSTTDGLCDACEQWVATLDGAA
jgi:hypothetical protein